MAKCPICAGELREINKVTFECKECGDEFDIDELGD